MIGAFLYLTRTTIRNRFAAQLRRLKNPRYAIALLLGLGYFYMFLFRPAPPGGRGAGVVWSGTQSFAAIGVLLLLLGAWLFRGDRMALAFSPAEVQFLLPAPVSRRELIGYKLFRAQVVILFNAIIWVFILRRSGSMLPSPLRFVGTWMLFTNLSLHRLGAALVRTSLLEHGRSGVRKNLASVLVGAAVLLASAWLVRDAVRLVRAADAATGIWAALQSLLTTPGARGLLFLPRVIIGPTFAQTPGAWAFAVGPALVLLVVQLVWVLASDVAFEEAAVQASAERARRLRMRRERMGGKVAAPKKVRGDRRTIPLAPVGLPAAAIVWKNVLLLLRTGRYGSVAAVVIFAVIVSVPLAEGRGVSRELVGVIALAITALLMLFGSRLLHNDFRQDAEHLATLKTLPLPGAHLVAAEVMSSALPLTLIQLLLVMVAFVALLTSHVFGMAPDTRVTAALLAPLVLFAFNVATVTLQNAVALLLPGWVKVQPTTGGGGVEVMGQSILALGMLFLSTAAALIPAAVVFAAVAFVLGPGAPYTWAISTVAAAAALLGEAWLAVMRLGRRFEKMEPEARV